MKAILMTLCSAIALCTAAQEVREQDIAFRKEIVKQIDLRDPVNSSRLGGASVFCGMLLEAAREGKLSAFRSDSNQQLLSYRDILERLSYGGGDSSYTYSTVQLYLVELTQELIFDKNRSLFLLRPTALTIFIPEEISQRSILEPVCTFQFSDCAKLWRTDARAAYLEPGFDPVRYGWEEVFLLDQFRAPIVKIGNDRDLYFDQMSADPMKATLIREQYEQHLMELMYSAFHPE